MSISRWMDKDVVHKYKRIFSSVQLLRRVRLFATPWATAHQVTLSITKFQSLPKLMPIQSVMSSNHLILCHPLLLLPSISPRIRVFLNKSALLIRWPKYWSFSFNVSSSNEHPGLISFRMDWLDLLAVQGTLKSLLQYHSSKASILWHSAFFIAREYYSAIKRNKIGSFVEMWMNLESVVQSEVSHKEKNKHHTLTHYMEPRKG